jgi:imidazolonepropionase
MTIALWHNATLCTLSKTTTTSEKNISTSDDIDWGLIFNGAILTRDGKILWVGEASTLPAQYLHSIFERHDLNGALVTPGLIDCHTHLVYGGHRALEFEMRLQGATYEDIARAGGGIRSTVQATRSASDELLFSTASQRAKSLICEGVTTVEIKSGYGLSLLDEARSLRVARKLGEELPLSVQTTYLAAHAVPPEFTDRSDDYIDEVCRWMPLLEAEGLIDAVDAFCDNIGFSTVQAKRIFESAKKLNLPIKLHAEQLSDQDGANLAAAYGALSCDHLEHLSAKGIAAMAKAGTVAVLLPGAFYFLRETKLPPIQALLQAGVPIAIATDHNPGSSPTLSPLLMLNMACTFFKLTPSQAFRGMTINAAKALGLKDRGLLLAGMKADFAVWQVEHPRELSYRFGSNPCLSRVVSGVKYNLNKENSL